MNKRAAILIVAMFLLVGLNTLADEVTTREAETPKEETRMPVMWADADFLERYEQDYTTEAEAYIDPGLQTSIKGTSDFSILDLLYYIPSERTQGYCGNCWMWPSTSVVEIALRVEQDVQQNRLSVQYINSCGELYPSTGIECCGGGTLTMFAKFYKLTGIAIPWSNQNAYWQDYVLIGQCEQCECDEIAKDPNYPIADMTARRITTRNVPEATAIANIKNILHQNRGVYFSVFYADTANIDNFRNFWRYQPESAVYDLDYYAGHEWNEEEAVGHAMLIVGYHDDETSNDSDYWVLLNSWGTNNYRPNGLLRIDMHMNYSLRYVGTTQYAFGAETLNITFGSAAPTTSISGPTVGRINKPYTFDVFAVDPQGDDVYLSVDWGDNTNTDWVGPYDSGEEIQLVHSFSERKNYTILAKAKDIEGHEGKEQPLIISMPTSYIPFFWFWERLFELFPNAFPILRHLFGF